MSETEQLSAEVIAMLASPDMEVPNNQGRPGLRSRVCKRGHDQTVHNARNKWGACRKCDTIRSLARYYASKEAKG